MRALFHRSLPCRYTRLLTRRGLLPWPVTYGLVTAGGNDTGAALITLSG